MGSHAKFEYEQCKVYEQIVKLQFHQALYQSLGQNMGTIIFFNSTFHLKWQ